MKPVNGASTTNLATSLPYPAFDHTACHNLRMSLTSPIAYDFVLSRVVLFMTDGA